MGENEANNTVQQKARTYIYRHVQFIVRGPKTGQKLIDFVPAKWVYVSKKSGKLVVKFMPPPYTEENSDVLQHLVKNLCDPIIDWPEYNVELRGGASSYEEAEERLKKLETQDYVFTTDADEIPEAKAAEIVRQLKQTKLKVSAEVDAALKVPILYSDNEAGEIDQNYDNGMKNVLPKKTVNSTRQQSSNLRSNRSTTSDNDRAIFRLKGHDHNGNLQFTESNKNKTAHKNVESLISSSGKPRQSAKLQNDESTSSIDYYNKELHLGKKKNKTDVKTTKSLFSSPGRSGRSSEPHRERYTSRVDVISDSSERSLQEVTCGTTSRSGNRLNVDNIYTDSENDSLKTFHSEDLASFRKKSQFSDHLKSKQTKKQETESNVHHGLQSKSKPKKTKDKYNFVDGDKQSTPTTSHRSKPKNITSDSELIWEIYKDVQKIKVDLEEIKANQRYEQEMRHNAVIEQGINENFILKHNLELSYTDRKAFEQFSSHLLSDEDFRQEFMKSLNKLFDRNVVPSRSLTNIIRKYLSSELAMQYTAIKKMPNKFLMKDTAFYDCLLGVLADTHHDKNGKFLTESAFSSILGNVLGNAKDWKGNRRRRMNRNPDPDQESSDQASGAD